MNEPARALVLQCRVCRRIVADSLTVVRIDEAMRVVVLSELAAAIVSETEIVGFGNERYKHVRCASCSVSSFGRKTPSYSLAQATIGRSFTTWPEALGDHGESYALDTEALTSYELGTTNNTDRLPNAAGAFSHYAKDDLRTEITKDIRKVPLLTLSCVCV